MDRPNKEGFGRILNNLSSPMIGSREATQLVIDAYMYMVDFYEQNPSSGDCKLPEGEQFVSTVVFKDQVIIASTKGIYQLSDNNTLTPIKFEAEK